MGAGGRRPVKGDFSPALAVAGGRRKAGMAGADDSGCAKEGACTIGLCVRLNTGEVWRGNGSQSIESSSRGMSGSGVGA